MNELGSAYALIRFHPLTGAASVGKKAAKAKSSKIGRKRKFSTLIRRMVWERHSPLNRAKCYCCGINDISPFFFEIGHVVAEARGGKDKLSNLRAICGQCNRSMFKENLEEFKRELEEFFCVSMLPPSSTHRHTPVLRLLSASSFCLTDRECLLTYSSFPPRLFDF